MITKRSFQLSFRFASKAISFLLCLLILCGSLAACRADQPEPTQTPLPTGETQSPTTQPVPPTTAEPTEATVPSTAAPEEALTLSTTGGAVIVGVIGKDEQGWYLAPDQLLTVEYHYFDEPSRFENLEKIRMFDVKDDGVDKNIYFGQLVTVKGAFSFYRDDFETLYLVPYQILIGKTVNQSYAAPGLEYPDEPADLYDPTKPLPPHIEPRIMDGRYIYNAFMLSKETISYYGNDFVFFYVSFVDAILNYAPQCACPDDNYAQLLSTVITYEIPLYEVCADRFEYDSHYDPETKMITIPYKYDEKTHYEMIDLFLAQADALLAQVLPEQTEQEKAMGLYHALATSVTYDYSALDDFDKKQTWNAFLNKTGVCITFANAYNILLTQVGIESRCAGGESGSGEPHAWSLVTIDGKQYFCDPTFELSHDGGQGYLFFGMSYAQRIENGTGAKGIHEGRYYSRMVDPATVAEESLDVSSYS